MKSCKALVKLTLNKSVGQIYPFFFIFDLFIVESGVLGVKGGGDELDMEKLPKLQG